MTGKEKTPSIEVEDLITGNPELEALREEVAELRSRNAAMVAGIENDIQQPLDPTAARTEHHFYMLAQLGIIPMELLLKMDLHWEQEFWEQLRNMRKQVEQQKRVAGLALPTGARGRRTLLGPGGQPIGSSRPENTGG